MFQHLGNSFSFFHFYCQTFIQHNRMLGFWMNDQLRSSRLAIWTALLPLNGWTVRKKFDICKDIPAGSRASESSFS
jgi:hypothetical protein